VSLAAIFSCVVGIVIAFEPASPVVQHRRPDGRIPTVLIVDVAGNGIRLQDASRGPRLRGLSAPTGWTVPNSDDAFVVVEQQENGRIDGVAELLGWQGPPNGFDYLRALDGTAPGPARFGRGQRSPDDVIDSFDAVFHRLVLWTDVNADGASTEQELQSAAFLGFKSFSLKTEPVERMVSGNRMVQTGRARRDLKGRTIDVDVVAVELDAR